jgi:hypothetical protein
MAPHHHNPRGDAGALRLAWLFVQNIGRHLRPSYLFVHGDINVRHSTQLVGELSWIDMLALGGGALLLARALNNVALTVRHCLASIRGGRSRPPSSELSSDEPPPDRGANRTREASAAPKEVPKRSAATARCPREFGSQSMRYCLARSPLGWSENSAALLFAATGMFAGIAPSALTYEGVPHALRSIGAWPFVALLSGMALARLAATQRFAPALAATVAVAFAGFFGMRYFVDYPPNATVAFDASDAEAAERLRGDPVALNAALRGAPELAVRYYLMAYGGDGCMESSNRMLGP